jgi:hypothetical protein
MLRQHAPAEWINLAERDRLEAARAFQPKTEAADAAEEIEHPQHLGIRIFRDR